MRYDLHSHSRASDGTLSSQELVTLAVSNEVQCLALTDHDTLAGLPAALECARSTRLQLIPGVEISVSWGSQTVHILGLNVDLDCRPLVEGLARLQQFRAWRAQEIGRQLEKSGYPNAYEGAKACSNGVLISRTHFAQHLISTGIAKNMQNVFRKFLVKNKPGYVAGQWASLQEALGWIKKANGLAVIAHPARYQLSATKLIALFDEFKAGGGAGLEVVSGSHRDKENKKMGQYANRFELYASAGSDFHGENSPWRKLGRIPPLPESVTPIWEADTWPSCEPSLADNIADSRPLPLSSLR